MIHNDSLVAWDDDSLHNTGLRIDQTSGAGERGRNTHPRSWTPADQMSAAHWRAGRTVDWTPRCNTSHSLCFLKREETSSLSPVTKPDGGVSPSSSARRLTSTSAGTCCSRGFPPVRLSRTGQEMRPRPPQSSLKPDRSESGGKDGRRKS